MDEESRAFLAQQAAAHDAGAQMSNSRLYEASDQSPAGRAGLTGRQGATARARPLAANTQAATQHIVLDESPRPGF